MGRKYQQGQILVETALVAVLVMFVLLGALSHFSALKPSHEANQLTQRKVYAQKYKYSSK